jgi:hypothetical protein
LGDGKRRFSRSLRKKPPHDWLGRQDLVDLDKVAALPSLPAGATV